MANLGFPNRQVSTSQFSMVPRPDVPRSTFRSNHTHKTTFDAGYLVPIYLDEILPGDSVSLNMTAFCRLSTPLFPVMDNLHFDTFFFFVPNRLIWDNWVKLMGEQASPGDSIDYLVPTAGILTNSKYDIGTPQDYFGLPAGDDAIACTGWSHSNLPLRAYNLIFNEWFRDENLVDPAVVDKDDGPDSPADYLNLLKRGKRYDYFTSALPWPQKGDPVSLPLTGEAPIRGLGVTDPNPSVSGGSYYETVNPGVPRVYADVWYQNVPAGNVVGVEAVDGVPAVYADLSEATASTINAIRMAFQVQKLLERDARGGTRYTEIIQSHFGVRNPDARLQRPEYLGGSTDPINVTPVAQTSATGLTGGSSPIGSLGAAGTGVPRVRWSQSFTEHGYIIGIANVRADLTYQQGLHKMWQRRTKYDFYWPAFAHLGEQAVLRNELMSVGELTDLDVFGYQERWAEYRHKPSRVSSKFRSSATGSLDTWHLAQEFAVQPTLSDTFINEDVPMERVLAAGSAADGMQFLCDCLFDVRHTRPMPVYSVPGMIDRF